MNYLIQKRKEIFNGRDFSLLYLILSSVLIISLLKYYQPEVVLLEEEFEAIDNEIKEINLITEEEIKMSPEEYINSLISTSNRKCSSSVFTKSRAIYYIRWDDIDTLWWQAPDEIKRDLNSLSSRIEAYWQQKGYKYIVELVLDSQLSDRVIAVSTNGKITFTRQ